MNSSRSLSNVYRKQNLMKFLVMSDLHLSRKPWQVRKALAMGRGYDAVLIPGDMTNDGTPPQFNLLYQCIVEILPNTPVLAVAGNHDFPVAPEPKTQDGICDYKTLQEWLLHRQPLPYQLDESGAYAVSIGYTEILGLNCVGHGRKFQFGTQLEWLAEHLLHSDAKWHIFLCHAPLRLHSPAGNTAPYLSRDKELQNILDRQGHCIFLSGHTHISMESPAACVEYDKRHHNLYVNSGSIRPTTLLDDARKQNGATAQGNVVELELMAHGWAVRAIEMRDGQTLLTYPAPEL